MRSGPPARQNGHAHVAPRMLASAVRDRPLDRDEENRFSVPRLQFHGSPIRATFLYAPRDPLPALLPHLRGDTRLRSRSLRPSPGLARRPVAARKRSLAIRLGAAARPYRGSKMSG